MIVVCPLCRLNYCEDLAEDRRHHRKLHKHFEEAIGAGCDLLTELEEVLHLEKAEKLLTSSNYVKNLVQGWQARLRYYYNRSLRHAIKKNFWQQHPEYDEYMAMVGQHFPNIPDEVREEFKNIYGIKDGGIKPGYSYWYPKDQRTF